ncbi:hypothetical protein [Levilinea saccharolytica]|uniref:hypothetical protein n=1 Tax=Levilinea saccharolytica TaxID=229921 RepID=UPI0011BD84B7|nr:hypothetical protein [Levilinea saccharolytica]
MTKTSWFSFFLVGTLLLSYGALSYLKLKKNQAAPPNPIVSEGQQLSSSLSSPELLLRGKIDHYDQTQQLPGKVPFQALRVYSRCEGAAISSLRVEIASTRKSVWSRKDTRTGEFSFIERTGIPGVL